MPRLLAAAVLPFLFIGAVAGCHAQRRILYVNVEAEHGHRERQVRMLEALARVGGLDPVAEAAGTVNR